MESIKQGRRLKPSLNPLKKKCEYLNYFHLQQAWANLKRPLHCHCQFMDLNGIFDGKVKYL
jgi:hypothetical protein